MCNGRKCKAHWRTYRKLLKNKNQGRRKPRRLHKERKRQMNHKEIQNEVIKKYRIDICDGTKCKDGDWHRTHAHPKQRRVCKWKQANSIQSTFTLLHEIGHIETKQSWMRRAESEYHATVWALDKCAEYGLEVPEKIIKEYQDYIDDEKERGLRRGGKGYADLKLPAQIKTETKTKSKQKNGKIYKLGWKANGQ